MSEVPLYGRQCRRGIGWSYGCCVQRAAPVDGPREDIPPRVMVKTFFSSVLLSSLELSDTKVFEP